MERAFAAYSRNAFGAYRANVSSWQKLGSFTKFVRLQLEIAYKTEWGPGETGQNPPCRLPLVTVLLGLGLVRSSVTSGRMCGMSHGVWWPKSDMARVQFYPILRGRQNGCANGWQVLCWVS
jgi:hypothetical protein